MIDVKVVGPKIAGEEKILTPEALQFVAGLQLEFGQIRENLLQRRKDVLDDIKKGKMPTFLPETKHIRDDGDWKVNPPPADLLERTVEITGPASSPTMMPNAFNSGSSVYMADPEDSESPTWANIINGQINLHNAIRRQIDFVQKGKRYKLDDKVAVLMFRPRGWHLLEKHVLVNGEPVSASLFDFGMYFYHNAKELVKRGTGVYLYLPKMESFKEADLWDMVFHFSEYNFGLTAGTIRATVLIETILAAFEMDEILYSLRHHSAGLNAGRWDYLFSFIKKFSHRPDFVLPDRGLVTMSTHMMKSYRDLLIKTCHRRGIHAMGGMSAFIPSKDEKTNNENKNKMEADKAIEVQAGHDGTWIAHPASQKDARDVFGVVMKGPNQLHVLREDVQVTEADLLKVPEGPVTMEGLRDNIKIGLAYLAAWLNGTGCVPLNNKMEDAATVEISRIQVWQCVKHRVGLSSGEIVSRAMVERLITEEAVQLTGDKVGMATELFREMVFAEECPDFLTIPAYEKLIELENAVTA